MHIIIIIIAKYLGTPYLPQVVKSCAIFFYTVQYTGENFLTLKSATENLQLCQRGHCMFERIWSRDFNTPLCHQLTQLLKARMCFAFAEIPVFASNVWQFGFRGARNSLETENETYHLVLMFSIAADIVTKA
jgi:hypothetical protein